MKLAILVATGSKSDHTAGHLLSGHQGSISDLLGRNGIAWSDVRVFSMLDMEHCSPRGDAEGMEAWFDGFEWDGGVVQGGIERLHGDLVAFNPTMILALGSAPWHLLHQGNVAPKRVKGGYVWEDGGVMSWRGSLFESGWVSRRENVSLGDVKGVVFEDKGVKCMASYHPSWLSRDDILSAYVRVDMRRVADELRVGPGLTLPKRKVHVASSAEEARQWLMSYHINCSSGELHLLSTDSEGGVSTLSMLGLVVTTHTAHVIPFLDSEGRSLWTEEEETAIWTAAKALLEDVRVRKVFQNWQSDAFILAWSYGIVVQGLAHDVMLEAWEAQPELEKGLATVASLYTREPFWKSSVNYRTRLAWVCGMDAMLTLECHQVLDRILKGGQREHYAFNLSLLPSVLYSMLEGLPFDKARAKRDLKALEEKIYETQHEIDKAAWEAAGGEGTARHSLDGHTQMDGKDMEQEGTEVDSRLPSHHSPQVARLAAWFGAIGGTCSNLPSTFTARTVQRASGSETILDLAATAFATARRVEKVEVIEERWQPMRWNGKRWVKAGKLTTSIGFRDEYMATTEPPGNPVADQAWLKPCPRTVKVSRTVPIDSWETLDRFCKESCLKDFKRAWRLAKELNAIHEEAREIGEIGDTKHYREVLGELSILLNVAINSGSTSQGGDSQWLLHEAWQLPKKFKKIIHVEEEAGQGEGQTPPLTTDASMLLSLYARCQQPEWSEWKRHSKLRGDELRQWLKVSSRRIELVLRMRKLVKERAYLDIDTDSDGRVRYGLNLVKAATGRFAAYGSPTGKSRLNPQTVGKKHRHLYTYV